MYCIYIILDLELQALSSSAYCVISPLKASVRNIIHKALLTLDTNIPSMSTLRASLSTLSVEIRTRIQKMKVQMGSAIVQEGYKCGHDHVTTITYWADDLYQLLRLTLNQIM